MTNEEVKARAKQLAASMTSRARPVAIAYLKLLAMYEKECLISAALLAKEAARGEAVKAMEDFVRRLAATTLCDDLGERERCRLDSCTYCGKHDRWADDDVREARDIMSRIPAQEVQT